MQTAVNPQQVPQRVPWTQLLTLASLLVLATFAAYGWSMGGAFLYDDGDSIPGNPSIRSLATALSPPPGVTVSGRPVLNLSFALNHALSGDAVWSYHLLNVALHAAAALLLFGIVRRTFAAVVGGWRDPGECAGAAFAAALLWALHPLQVESVAYVVQRAESLMGLFLLLALYAFIRRSEAGPRAGVWAAVSVAACLLGMGCKEVMATAPLLILLYDRAFVAGSLRGAWGRSRLLYSAYAVCWMPLAWLVAHTGGRGGSAGFGSGVPWWAYALTQFKAIAHYMLLSVRPFPLVGDYGRILAGNPLEVAFCATVVLAAAAWTWVLLRRNSPLGFLGAWFFVILAPSSSVVPVSTEIMAEHRMYLPLAAVAVLAVVLLRRVLGTRLIVPAACVVAAILGVMTELRTQAYRDSYTFWSDVARKVPANAGAWNNLGLILQSRGDSRGAIEDYLRALAIAPHYAYAHYNLGNALLAAGHAPESVEQFEKALEFRADDPAIPFALGGALAAEGRWLPAAAAYRSSLKLNPTNSQALFGLGEVMVRAGNLPEAAKAYGAVVAMHPELPDSRVNLGNVLAQQGRFPEALQQLKEALRLDPRAADVHNDLGSLLAGNGRLAEARAEFEEALRLRPDYPEARDNLRRAQLLEQEETGR